MEATEHSTKVALNIHHWSSHKQTAKFLKFNHFTSKGLDFFSIQNTLFLCLLYLNSVCFIVLPSLSLSLSSHLKLLLISFPSPGYTFHPHWPFSQLLQLLTPFQISSETLPQHSLWMALATWHSSREAWYHLFAYWCPRKVWKGRWAGRFNTDCQTYYSFTEGFRQMKLCDGRWGKKSKVHWPLSV